MCLCLCLSLIVAAPVSAEEIKQPDSKKQQSIYSVQRILVRFKQAGADNEAAEQKITDALAQVGGRIVRSYSVAGLKLVALDGDISVEEAVGILNDNPAVMYAEPDYKVNIDQKQPQNPDTVPPPNNSTAIPNDPLNATPSNGGGSATI